MRKSLVSPAPIHGTTPATRQSQARSYGARRVSVEPFREISCPATKPPAEERTRVMLSDSSLTFFQPTPTPSASYRARETAFLLGANIGIKGHGHAAHQQMPLGQQHQLILVNLQQTVGHLLVELA